MLVWLDIALCRQYPLILYAKQTSISKLSDLSGSEDGGVALLKADWYRLSTGSQGNESGAFADAMDRLQKAQDGRRQWSQPIGSIDFGLWPTHKGQNSMIVPSQMTHIFSQTIYVESSAYFQVDSLACLHKHKQSSKRTHNDYLADGR